MTLKQLPPLNTLKYFESAARNLSFTKAATELYVTHGAVSKQIKALESYLGTSLFVRQHRQLALTEAGQRYLLHISTALHTIDQATDEITLRASRHQALSVNVLPSLTINWLIPRLEAFKRRAPQLYVDLSIGDFQVDFSQQHYDIAIRSATSTPKGCNVIKLMDEDLCLVCAPQLASQLTQPSDINNMTLLKHTTRPELWPYWAEKVGVTLTTSKKFGMEHFYMLSQAAVSGMGVALIPRFFIEQELNNGSLVIPFSAGFTSPYAYYVLTPQATHLPEKSAAFIDWILEILKPYRSSSSR
ncbi:LysR family transcriptional regulator [Shewanella colwelliana]|uniref:LysR family transcriptional regulator n=1 Tax=Shewanella colwelliana TaxID=23 RepID=A0A1E5IW14_SHECO|nr:transcriptional regulator GcvA [Shewanella colwelliana]MDX1281294.1 transcriptional regulator GcvA [Shewanella colwelliana]OEG74740.1 LysR family transcriptional regulator [Shewanella colwelliana]GIU22939.1 LysR family transcriptional regulator [Shewanella colwelliana]GIU36309.1 LysR family transcriptional regulator [Shewanella colwelliana]